MRAFETRYNHKIISLDDGTDMAAHLPPGVPVSFPLPGAPPRGLARLGELRRLLARIRPDVLVTYNWGAIEWAAANRFRPLASAHVHIEDGFGPEERAHQLKRRVWFRRLALSGAHTRIVLPSQNLVRIATEQWRLGGQVRYIANGIDCDRFRTDRGPPPPLREAHGGGDAVAGRTDENASVFIGDSQRKQRGLLTVGTVATLRPEKNLLRLIAAFAEAQRQRPALAWRLLIVGDGPERAKLEKAAAATGGSILFPGASETPEQFLAQMDIFAMSSDTEQMPLGVLEAMASGLPVVSTKVGDVAAMLAAENGPYVTPLDDAQGLTRSLVVLADDAGARMRIGEANRTKVVADYDYRVMAEHYAELFD